MRTVLLRVYITGTKPPPRVTVYPGDDDDDWDEELLDPDWDEMIIWVKL